MQEPAEERIGFKVERDAEGSRQILVNTARGKDLFFFRRRRT